jgi:hypothetical protein
VDARVESLANIYGSFAAAAALSELIFAQVRSIVWIDRSLGGEKSRQIRT